MRNTAGTPELLKRMNSSVLLETIRERGPISRPALAEITGLSLPTVNARVRRLVEAGYASEVGKGESRGGKLAGLVEFNGSFGYVAGIDLGGSQVSVSLSDAAGQPVAFERRLLDKPVGGAKVAAAASEALGRTLSEHRLAASDLMVVGVSVPGVVDPATGEVTAAANIPDWQDSRPLDRLEKDIARPLVVENNVNAAIVGERWRGAARGVGDAVFVAVGAGIGAGILVGDRLHRGWRGGAGEVGLLRELHDDSPSPRGTLGPLERRASGPGIAARYREFAGIADEDLTAQSIFEKAAAGDAIARRVVDETVSFLAGGVVNICAVLAPELVVLGGGVARAGAALADPIRARLQKALLDPPRLVLSELGDAASVTGAVRIALDEADRREFFFHLSEGGKRFLGSAG